MCARLLLSCVWFVFGLCVVGVSSTAVVVEDNMNFILMRGDNRCVYCVPRLYS